MVIKLDKGFSYEANPYRAEFPEYLLSQQPELARVFREFFHAVREQHNVTQAGDTTFPWTELTSATSTPLYHVGSYGRFLHPDHGLIFARYVRFVTPGIRAEIGAPVGWAASPAGFNWEVTTDFSASAANRIVGLQASYDLPVDGDYGWVIVEGINIMSVTTHKVGAPIAGERLTWIDDGVAEAGAGNLFGTIVSVSGMVGLGSDLWEVAPGMIRVLPRGA